MPGLLAVRRRSPPLLLAAVVVAACSSGPTGPAVACLSATAHASPLLYVANGAGKRITVYSASDTGNAAPTATIEGSNTGLSWPWGIARDTAGRAEREDFGGFAGPGLDP